MPIPLGIIAAAGVRAAGGSYELIETITVGAGGAASVTFSNLNTYNTTYQHLQIRYVARNTNGEAGGVFTMRFNSDSGSNYAFHSVIGNGSSVSSSAATSQQQMFVGRATTSGDTSNAFGAGVVDILDAYEAKNKTVRALTGQVATYNEVNLRSGLWLNTNAVSSITILPNGSTNWVQFSRFSIYGLKAS